MIPIVINFDAIGDTPIKLINRGNEHFEEDDPGEYNNVFDQEGENAERQRLLNKDQNNIPQKTFMNNIQMVKGQSKRISLFYNHIY